MEIAQFQKRLIARCWTLDAHFMPVKAVSFCQWATWMESGLNSFVARTELDDDVCVSTVFLGSDIFLEREPPLLFETMVFGGPLDTARDRYATYDEAIAGHANMVEKARTP